MLNTIHKTLAAFILLFIFIHLCNHIAGLWGIEVHIEFMEMSRKFYRNIFIEPLLLIAIFIQILLGVYFVYRSWDRRSGFFSRAQAVSGCYLALFLLVHVAATLNARELLHLDTNFYFASAGIHIANLGYFFIPYYFLAVVAIFIHIASAAHWFFSSQLKISLANNVGTAIIIVGIIISSLIIAMLTGVFYDITIPKEYGVMFD